jgi:hypothetical protein
MGFDSETIRALILWSMMAFLLVLTPYLWFIDLLTRQKTFALLLSAELAAFSMLIYVATKPDYDSLKKSWMLTGCGTLAALLLLAIAVQ